MALTILNQVGEDNPRSVLATTILSYSLSSVLTGAVFFVMGKCKLGSLIGFFPRHILIGCIGGVGWFLVATGLEVSARLDGSLEYNIETLQKLTQPDTILLWIIPLILAVVLLVAKWFIKHPLTDSTFFLSIIAIFYVVVGVVPDLKIPELRAKGWIFEAPEAGVPFYHFYSLYGMMPQARRVYDMTDSIRLWRCELGGTRGNSACDACSDIFRDLARTHQHPSLRTDNWRR